MKQQPYMLSAPVWWLGTGPGKGVKIAVKTLGSTDSGKRLLTANYHDMLNPIIRLEKVWQKYSFNGKPIKMQDINQWV